MATGTTPVLTHSPGVDEHSSRAGLRAVASLEALKGLLVIVVGVLLLFFHTRVEDVTEGLLDHMHVDLDSRVGGAVMKAATKVSTAHLWSIVAITFSYSLIRFVEAWGLWNRRIWAEWFALLSGAMYLPFELAKVAEKATWERVVIFGVNLVIVLYMLWIRVQERRFAA